MARTSPVVLFGLYDLTIKQKGAPSTAASLQPFSKVDDLRTERAQYSPVATFEPDYWLLDGQYKFRPDNDDLAHVGLISLAQSDASGDFASPPALQIDFATAQSIDSLTLHFSAHSGDYASALTVAYYGVGEGLIRSDAYSPTSADFSTGQGVGGFTRVVVTFQSTNRPYRYLRVSGIDYGEFVKFEGAQIKAASLVEEVDPLAGEVRINTFELRLHSADQVFNPINPSGEYARLAERLPLVVYEKVDSGQALMGYFYLDTWKNASDTEIEFSCVDLLGVLDTQTCLGGLWPTSAAITLTAMLEIFLGPIGVPYELDPSLASVNVSGWIPIGTYRETLQQIGLAVGAAIDCSRSNAVRIYPTPMAATGTATETIARSEQGQGGHVSLAQQVTGVEVTAHDYAFGSVSREVFRGSLPVGVHTLTFDEPQHSRTITGGTLLLSWANHAIVEVTTAGTVVLNGIDYIDNRRTFSQAAAADGLKNYVLKISDATMVNSSNGAAVAQRVYDYYQQRLIQEMKLFAPAIETGQIVEAEALYGKVIRGVVEKMEIDLAGGFTARIELRGVEA